LLKVQRRFFRKIGLQLIKGILYVGVVQINPLQVLIAGLVLQVERQGHVYRGVGRHHLSRLDLRSQAKQTEQLVAELPVGNPAQSDETETRSGQNRHHNGDDPACISAFGAHYGLLSSESASRH